MVVDGAEDGAEDETQEGKEEGKEEGGNENDGENDGKAAAAAVAAVEEEDGDAMDVEEVEKGGEGEGDAAENPEKLVSLDLMEEFIRASETNPNATHWIGDASNFVLNLFNNKSDISSAKMGKPGFVKENIGSEFRARLSMNAPSLLCTILPPTHTPVSQCHLNAPHHTGNNFAIPFTQIAVGIGGNEAMPSRWGDPTEPTPAYTPETDPRVYIKFPPDQVTLTCAGTGVGKTLIMQCVKGVYFSSSKVIISSDSYVKDHSGCFWALGLVGKLPKMNDTSGGFFALSVPLGKASQMRKIMIGEEEFEPKVRKCRRHRCVGCGLAVSTEVRLHFPESNSFAHPFSPFCR